MTDRIYPPRNPFPMSADDVRISRRLDDEYNRRLADVDRNIEMAIMMNRALEWAPIDIGRTS